MLGSEALSLLVHHTRHGAFAKAICRRGRISNIVQRCVILVLVWGPAWFNKALSSNKSSESARKLGNIFDRLLRMR